ncbi:LOW QUALITY PROTEIN: stimulated by retinoic acid gene 6 protein-like [Argopecten irradians]|uniref:LOW QUALITY PROTEIN: stimulated by retinoic acid gene 6 protein-like n=1 Tax=Argopecten irradians TaxID=31199 RepID=UPI00371159DC
MSFAFLQGIQELEAIFASEEDNTTDYEENLCEELVSHQTFYLAILGPAVVFTLLLAFTEKRYVKRDCCGGRPGLVYPQDVIGRSNRVSYAAAFGSIAYLCSGVIFEGKYAIEYTGPLYLKVFILLLSMLIYGIGYYPLFLSLAMDSIPGYIIGILYAWTITGMNFAKTFHCSDLTALSIGLLVLRGFPEFLCQIYLCFSLPVRLILRIRRRNIVTSKDVEKEARSCYSGLHVRKLFEKPQPPKPEPETMKAKILALIKSLPARLVYFNIPKFRYSGRVLSVFAVAFIILYQVTVELFTAAYTLFDFGELFLGVAIVQIGEDPTPDEPEAISAAREKILYLLFYILTALRGCFLTSLVVGFLLGCVLILHSLCTYRMFLLDSYKGNTDCLIPKEDSSNGSKLVGFMRYAGYQVAYIGWGYFVQTIVLFVISMVIATVVIMFQFGIGGWIIDKIHAVWPVLLTSLAVNIIQLLMARCVFLQKRGEFLALNNRRLFFIVVYFMFFYNIFLGLVSCLLRILKAILVGAFFLPRLDHSTLPRRFQWFDPGFAAYCGFMYVESAHTNPCAITFIKMLKIETLTTKELAAGETITRHGRRKNVPSKASKYIALTEKGGATDEEKLIAQRKSRQALFRWQTAYTLIRNPELMVRRKFDMMKSLELLGKLNNPMEKSVTPPEVSIIHITKKSSEDMV